MNKTAVSIWNSLAGFIYPRLCLGCNRRLLAQENVLCIECTELLPQTNYHHVKDNATFQRLEGRVELNFATSLGYYTKEGLLQYLIHELKYKRNEDAGKFMGQKLANALKNIDWIKDVNLIVPVPLHKHKQQARGYNQSAIIANVIAKNRGVRLSIGNLIRIVDTDSQTTKGREQRLENMKEAFIVQNKPEFASKHILLVDDILTTGATIEQCALIMQQAGASKVSIATVGVAI